MYGRVRVYGVVRVRVYDMVRVYGRCGGCVWSVCC